MPQAVASESPRLLHVITIAVAAATALSTGRDLLGRDAGEGPQPDLHAVGPRVAGPPGTFSTLVHADRDL